MPPSRPHPHEGDRQHAHPCMLAARPPSRVVGSGVAAWEAYELISSRAMSSKMVRFRTLLWLNRCTQEGFVQHQANGPHVSHSRWSSKNTSQQAHLDALHHCLLERFALGPVCRAAAR